MDPDGRVAVSVGVASQGQGHETTLAQVAADTLSLDFDRVRVTPSDTAYTPMSVGGTRASRVAVVAGGAVARAAGRLREQLLDAAGRLLEVDAEDLCLRDGRVHLRGDPSAGIDVDELAHRVFYSRDARPPVGDSETLIATAFYDPPPRYSSGCVIADVSVDTATGHARVDRVIAVDDCGTVINPTVVAGQVVGGLMQAVGLALVEEVTYDDIGQMQTSTFVDYLLPSAAEAPRFVVEHLPGDDDARWDRVKGVGEAGMVGGPAAIVNAVYDAAGAQRQNLREVPLTPRRVYELLHPAGRAG